MCELLILYIYIQYIYESSPHFYGPIINCIPLLNSSESNNLRKEFQICIANVMEIVRNVMKFRRHSCYSMLHHYILRCRSIINHHCHYGNQKHIYDYLKYTYHQQMGQKYLNFGWTYDKQMNQLEKEIEFRF